MSNLIRDGDIGSNSFGTSNYYTYNVLRDSNSHFLDGSTIYIQNFTADDNAILKVGSSKSSNTNTTDGVIYVSADNGIVSYYIYTDANDEQLFIHNIIIASSQLFTQKIEETFTAFKKQLIILKKDRFVLI